MMPFRHLILIALFTNITWLGHQGPSQAADLAPANGQVVLTIVGNIQNSNRPAFDEFSDPFTNYHEKKFENAAEFDLAMLESFGMHEVEVNYEDWPRPLLLAGPRLKDVLDAAGAEPSNLTVLALDGFASNLSADMLASEDWLVAIKLDGHYMNIGQRGPAWVVFDPGEDKSITAEEEGTWPWAAFFIEVE